MRVFQISLKVLHHGPARPQPVASIGIRAARRRHAAQVRSDRGESRVSALHRRGGRRHFRPGPQDRTARAVSQKGR